MGIDPDSGEITINTTTDGSVYDEQDINSLGGGDSGITGRPPNFSSNDSNVAKKGDTDRQVSISIMQDGDTETDAGISGPNSVSGTPKTPRPGL